MIRWVVFCSLTVISLTLVSAESNGLDSHSQGRTLFLLTWKSHNGSWYYLLHEGPTFKDAIKHDGRGKKGPMRELKHELLKYKDDMIFWSSSRTLKFEYPPREDLNDILGFAQSHRIYLQVLPTIEE